MLRVRAMSKGESTVLKPFILLVIITLLSCTIISARKPPSPSTSQTDVPVKSVVLFSSGVGYFEHSGTVHGDGSTELLAFRTSQINDILKSLVLQDLDGGHASTITYPSQDPIGKTLRSFQVDITNNPSLGDLLNQLRGAKVTIQATTEKITGTVLGVEQPRCKPVDKGEPVNVAVLNILSGAMIRAIELDSINNLDAGRSAASGRTDQGSVTALTQARDQDKKSVTLNFTGQGDRRIKIGYVVETPIWKTSYRLILDDKGGKLQGWAIVENQTESDWNNVQLSLVSGRPISFVMDLYQPLYVARPVVQQELYASLRPTMYDAGMQQSQVQDMAVAEGALLLAPHLVVEDDGAVVVAEAELEAHEGPPIVCHNLDSNRLRRWRRPKLSMPPPRSSRSLLREKWANFFNIPSAM